MKLKLKAAMLGGGSNSAVGKVHKIASEMDGNFEIVAGCFSRNKEINSSSGLLYSLDLERIYSTLSEMINAEAGNIDVVIVVTPSVDHGKQVVEIIRAGIPVICEKGLVMTLAEAENLLKNLELDGNKNFVASTFNYTGYPMVRELKAKIAQGEFGRIHSLFFEMPQEGYIKRGLDGAVARPQAWRLADGEIPIISMDLGAHLYSMANFLIDIKPLEVVSVSRNCGNFENIIDDISCLVKYEGDVLGNFWYGKAALGYQNGLKIRIFGDKGSGEWVQANPEILTVCDMYGTVTSLNRASSLISAANMKRYERFKAGHPAGYIEAFANYYQDIAEELRLFKASSTNYEKTGYVLGAHEVISALKLSIAVNRSSKEKGWVRV